MYDSLNIYKIKNILKFNQFYYFLLLLIGLDHAFLILFNGKFLMLIFLKN